MTFSFTFTGTVCFMPFAAVKRLIAGEQVTQEQSGMSKGEWRDLMEVLERTA